MKVAVTGGGSGGHITPILAVAHELKRSHPDAQLSYISHSGDSLDDVVAADKTIDAMYSVRAGKFRRYNGEGWQQLLDFKTMFLNLRDAGFILVGLWQSFWLLRRIRPDIIFTRGSYVSVPVCLAAAVLGIPYITHDSDAIPSLTNRLISHWAAVHAVALDEELYPYPLDTTVTVGVPIAEDYLPVTDELRKQYKAEVNLQAYDQVLLITGGGLGAERINTAAVANAAELLQRFPGLAIIHLTGRLHAAAVQAAYQQAIPASQLGRVEVSGFISDMYRYSGAASLVLARGGATNLAELAVQGKACIIVPNPLLTGGHQLKNTAALEQADAIIAMTEDQLEQELRLAHLVTELLADPARLQSLAHNLQAFSRPDAAKRIVGLLDQYSRAVQ